MEMTPVAADVAFDVIDMAGVVKLLSENGKVVDTLETMVCPGDVVFKPTETLLPAWPGC